MSRSIPQRVCRGACNSLIIGAPGGTRTPDPRLRRPVLYPVELRAPGPAMHGEQAGFSWGLVGVTGFEPATSCSQSRRATGLRYTPNEGGTIALRPRVRQTSGKDRGPVAAAGRHGRHPRRIGSATSRPSAGTCRTRLRRGPRKGASPLTTVRPQCPADRCRKANHTGRASQPLVATYPIVMGPAGEHYRRS
jgi:hypothetical protein